MGTDYGVGLFTNVRAYTRTGYYSINCSPADQNTVQDPSAFSCEGCGTRDLGGREIDM